MLNDGTKIRKTEADEFIPSFAENVDVCITKKCSVGCPFCYEGCSSNGKHANLFGYKFIESLHPYTEMALNGNDLDNPDLLKFLAFLKERSIFANITVHQSQFMNNFDLLSKLVQNRLIYGVGVSYHHYSKTFLERFKTFKNGVIHCINGIITPEDIDKLKGNGLKLLILGYKKLRRGTSYLDEHEDLIQSNQRYLYDNIGAISKDGSFTVVSFDNLAIRQLDIKRILSDKDWEEFYMGDDGGYTFYIDMVEGKFAKNSLSEVRYEIGDKTIDEMFKIIQENNK
jgi:hypothetical protein